MIVVAMDFLDPHARFTQMRAQLSENNWYSAFLVNDASQKNCRGLLLGKTCRGRNFFQLFFISFPNASKF